MRFAAPVATRLVFQHPRPFLAINAYHAMSRYRLTLMIAVMIHGKGPIVAL
jgi:hypothetical protein